MNQHKLLPRSGEEEMVQGTDAAVATSEAGIARADARIACAVAVATINDELVSHLNGNVGNRYQLLRQLEADHQSTVKRPRVAVEC